MRRIGWTALAAALLLTWAGKAQAQDTIRLGGTGDAKVQSLVYDGQANTELTHWGGWRGGHWGHWGYHAHFYRPWVGYRPYWGYRPYYAYGYRPYAYWPRYYSSYYAPSYYYYPPTTSCYVEPISIDPQTAPTGVVLGSSSYAQPPVIARPANSPILRLPPPARDDGTYPYDGGPVRPMPMPGPDEAAPMQQKRPTVPLDGKLVSLPSQRTSTYTYEAYGETSPPPSVATSPARVASTTSTPGTIRVSYPAYGER